MCMMNFRPKSDDVPILEPVGIKVPQQDNYKGGLEPKPSLAIFLSHCSGKI